MRYVATLLAFAPVLAFAESSAVVETTHPMLDVSIVANDGAKAAEFYGDVLGLKAGPTADIANGAKLLRYQVGAATLRIVIPKSLVPKYSEAMDEAIGIRGLALHLADAPEQFAKRLANHGLSEPNWVTGKNGTKLARLTDPDGNWIELVFDGSAADKLNRMAIILMVADEGRSREFYGKTLGLQETEPHGKPKTGLLYAYAAGGSTILVRGVKDVPNHAGKITDAVGIRAITFYVKDVDSMQGELEGRGAKIAVAPFNHGGLMRTMWVLDPDGNYLEFDSPMPAGQGAGQ